MISKHDVVAYLDSKSKPLQYSRTNFDQFLGSVNFKFKKEAIHITGTNGKGSVAYLLSTTLIRGGYKVGRFVSPSLHTPHEMISINDINIDEETFLSYLNKYREAFDHHGLTVFEIIAFIAFCYFEDQKIDLAIIEVGMGGKIDATNIFKPILSIITNVSLEHTSFLGKTIKEIATHKAGIIKTKTPILVGNLNLEAFSVVANTAMKKEAPLYVVKSPSNIRVSLDGICFDALDYKDICLSIPASYEAQNAAIVLNALEIISKKFPLESRVVFAAFKHIKIPARFSVMKTNPLIIIDGAHNPAAISALINSVKMLSGEKIHCVFAAFKDKDVVQELDMFALANADVKVTTFNHYRARKGEEYPPDYPFYADYQSAIKETLAAVMPNEVLLITGSLHFAFQVYEDFMKGLIV